MKHWKARQQGVVLPITLIVLVAMTLAGIALLRSLDTSSVIAGNLAFKQSATASADNGIEAAIAALGAGTFSLDQDQPANGYYATSQDGLDITGNATTKTDDDLNWSTAPTLPVDSAGNVVAYVIHRMCNYAGPLNASTCATTQSLRSGSSHGIERQMMTYQPGSWTDVADGNSGIYRITARVTGPRNTTSYVQVVVSI